MKVRIKDGELFVDGFGVCFKTCTFSTYDSKGNRLWYIREQHLYWSKRTYDSRSNNISMIDSTGYWMKKAYDSRGNELSYYDSAGWCEKSLFDSKGKFLDSFRGYAADCPW